MEGPRQLQLELTLPEAEAPTGPPQAEEARVRAQELADAMQARLGRPVRLFVTDNRSSLLTAREERGVLVVRLHHMFLGCDEHTLDALCAFCTGRRRKSAGRIIDEHIERNRDRIRATSAASPQAPADPEGEHHHLGRIFDRLNRDHFRGRVVARIGWGRPPGQRRRRRRSIKMGSYLHAARLIRIHPALDRKEVPEYYVAWVVFHEMLHQVVPPVVRGGRTYYHPPAFRKLERAFPDADRARVWEEANFSLLLR